MKNYLFLILCFINLPIIAQDMNQLRIIGKGEFLPSELIDRDVKDANGEVAAGLIIETDLVGLAYDANNGIVKMNHQPGRDFLFLQHSEREVIIMLNGYAPLQVILRKYEIKLESGQSWLLKLTGDKKLDMLPVIIMVNKPGAKIYADNEYKGTDKNINIPPGKHTIRVELQGCETISKEIEVTDKQTYFSFELTEIDVVSVEIRSVPEKAKVYINNDLKEKETDAGFFLYPGNYSVRLTKEGYLPVEEKIKVESAKQNKFVYTLKKSTGMLTISANPAGAEVRLNEKIISERSLELAPGEYSIDVTASGFISQRENLTIQTGQTINKKYTLVKNRGRLSVKVSQAGVKVVINKETTIISDNIELAPGVYKLELSKPGYSPVFETVEIKLGETTVKEYSLLAIYGKLTVGVTPLDGELSLSKEGKVIESWNGMKVFNKLIIGEYELTVKADKYKTVTKKIIIEENKTVSEDIILEEGRDVKGDSGNLIFVKGGSFMMGSNEYEREKPIHKVTVSDFYIGKYEVTQKEWQEIMGNNPSSFKGDDLPVETVSWNDVQEYITKLNAKTGKKYRLPTEAEWEYAARGGNKSRNYTYSGSNSIDEVAWYSSNSGSKTHSVGTKRPNELGIYDMSGNVWEWCSDWYGVDYYKSSPEQNPKGASNGDMRLLRGGSWYYDYSYCRVSIRNHYNVPDLRNLNFGFRVVEDF